jgi:hypothetical protein
MPAILSGPAAAPSDAEMLADLLVEALLVNS